MALQSKMFTSTCYVICIRIAVTVEERCRLRSEFIEKEWFPFLVAANEKREPSYATVYYGQYQRPGPVLAVLK